MFNDGVGRPVAVNDFRTTLNRRKTTTFPGFDIAAMRYTIALDYTERKIGIASTVAKYVLAVRHNPNIQTRRVFVFFSLPSSN